jgi:ATP diphosphatase
MSKELDRLVDIMRQLRNPVTGCPWDLEQNFKTIASHTLEETYELVEAIENDNPKAILEELGDVLFQVIFHARIAEESGLFTLEDVARQVTDKMIERHPHVFGDRDANSTDKVLKNWEADKAAKREALAKASGRNLSALDGVSTALPAATRAVKLQNRAARVGFDWTDAKDILAKIHEEADELKAEIDIKDNHDAIEDELGDLFFALVNLARKLTVDPETALRRTNAKFERRFRGIEDRLLTENKQPQDVSLDELEKHWIDIKRLEKVTKT